MANQNFRVKKGLEVGVGATVILADGNAIGINTVTPQTGNVDVNKHVRLQQTLEATGFSTFTGDVLIDSDLTVTGIASYTQLDADLSQIGVLTASSSYLGFTTIGVASVGFATVTDIVVGNGTYTGINTFTGTIFADDLSIAGVVTASEGNFIFTNLQGENILFTGIGTFSGFLDVNKLKVGVATLGIVGIETSLDVSGITTLGTADALTGFVTTRSDAFIGRDLYVGRDLDLTGNLRLEDIFARNIVVSGAATFTSGVTTFLDAENIEVGVSTIGIASVGFATVTDGYTGVSTVNDIYVENLLYDSNGVVGAGDSILATAGGKLVWTRPDLVGIATGFDPGNTFYVAKNGSDSNNGLTPEKAFQTINYALSQISDGSNNILEIAAGEYEETFPLSVPDGLTVKGAGQRAVFVRPTVATETQDGFLMGDSSTVEDLTIGFLYKPQGSNTYAFKYKNNTLISNRSPYVQRVTVFNKGSNITANDPYGFNTADSYPSQKRSSGGILVDGSEVQAGSLEAGFLFNEVTLFTPNNVGLEMTNGARVELLNSFIYFASEGIKADSDLNTGLAGNGKTILSLDGLSSTPSAGNTIEYRDTSGTVVASGTIESVRNNNVITLQDSGTGVFTKPKARRRKRVNFVGDAAISTTQARFGTASLDISNGLLNAEGITVDNDTDFGFGTGDFTIEFFFYRTTDITGDYLFDFRSAANIDAISLVGANTDNVNLEIAGSTIISGSQTIAANSWTHIAVTKASGTIRLYVNGNLDGSTANATDLGSTRPLHVGVNFNDLSGADGFIDELSIEKGFAKYTGGSLTPPSSEIEGDENTALLLHFNEANGSTATADDTNVTQDIQITGGITAIRINTANYTQFGADLRSIACAVEYGQKGVVGGDTSGLGVSLRLFAINFNFVGSNGAIDNAVAIQANEIEESNDAEVSYVSIDQRGDFRVGESFFVNQETGEVSFDNTVTDLTALSSLTISDGGSNSSVITPTSGRFGNILIAGNQIESTTGNIILNPAGEGEVDILGNVNVAGILTAQVIEINSIQNQDTSIALDDTGTDGTIRFNTDAVEAMRIDNQQRLGIGTATVRADLDVVGQTQLEDLEVTGVTTTQNLAVGAAATIGFATITDAYIGVATVGAIGISSVNIDDAIVGVATITVADITSAGISSANITDAIVGVATITSAGISSANLTDAIIGVATVTSAGISSANLTDAIIGVSTITSAGISSANIDDAIIGVSTITLADIEDADIEFGDIADGQIGVLTVTGVSTFTGESVFESNVTVKGDLNVDGSQNAKSFGAEFLSISGIASINTGIITTLEATNATIEAAGISSANIDDAIIGVATVTSAGISSANITDAIIGVSTITSAGISSANIDDVIIGVATVTSAGISSANITDAIIGVSTITSAGISSANIDDAIIGVSTITSAGISSANIDDAIIGVATVTSAGISSANLTDAIIGVATITSAGISSANLTDAIIGLATVTTAGISSALIQSANLGVATVGFATLTDAAVGGALTVYGDLDVVGDISYDEVTGRNLNITGIATIGTLGVSTDLTVDRNLSVLGIATVGVLSTADAMIGVASVGIVTAKDGFFETLTFGSSSGGGSGEGTGINSESVRTGNLYVSGITTINSGFATSFDIEDLAADVADITDLNVGTSTATFTKTTNLEVLGITTTQDLKVGGASTFVGFTTFQSSISVDGDINVSGSQNVQSFGSVDLAVSGIATIATANIATLNYNLGVGTASTITDLAVTGVTTTGFITATSAFVRNDLTVGGNLNVTGDISYDEVTGRNLNITGVGTIAQLGVTTFTTGTADITAAGISSANIDDAIIGLATVTTAGITSALIESANLGVATVGFATITDTYIGVSTIGLATINDAVIGVATVGFTTIIDAYVGVATVGFATLTDAAVGGGLTVYGDLDVKGDISYDEVSGRNLNISGVGTIRDFVSTASTIGVASITDANIGVATVGVLSVTDRAEFDRVVGYSATFTDLEVTGAVALPGIPILGGDADFRNLSVGAALTVTGVATFSNNVRVEGDLFVVGSQINSGLGAEELLVTGVGTIAQLGVTTFFAGLGTITSFVSAASTITLADIEGADVGVATVGVATITYANIVESETGISTIGLASISDANIGVATVGFATITDAFVGVLTANETSTNSLTVNNTVSIGDTVGFAKTAYFASDIIVIGETVGFGSAFFGDILANDLDTDTITVGVVTATDITVSLAATVGVLSATDATITNDLTVKGNLNVTGDISYDEVSGRNLNISGVGTISQLGVTTFQAGLGTITDFVSTASTITTATITDAIVGFVDADDADVGFLTFTKSVGTSLTVTDLVVSGIATLNGAGIATEGGSVEFAELAVSGVSTFGGIGTFYSDLDVVGLASITDAQIGVATVGLLSATTAGVGTITAFDATFQSLTVPNGGTVSLPGIPVSEGDATFRNLNITGLSSFTSISTFRSDVYIEGTLYTSGDVVQDSVSADNATFGTVGINTGLTITGYSTFSGATITGVTTITELADLNVSGVSTVGFITATDVWVSGMITAQDVNSLSDRRVKENIRNIEKPLEKIDRLNGVKFDFINSGKKSMGVIAQEVEQVFPELISGEFPKSVNYNGLIGLLIESVKELKQQNETMQAEIERLKNK